MNEKELRAEPARGGWRLPSLLGLDPSGQRAKAHGFAAVLDIDVVRTNAPRRERPQAGERLATRVA